MMKLPDLDHENVPKFNVGDRVWVILYRRLQEAEVLSSSFELCNSSDGKRQILLHMGYRLNVYNSDRLGLDKSFYPYEVYASQETVLDLTRWHSTEGISRNEWYKVLRDDEKDESFERSEVYRCGDVSARLRSLLFSCEKNDGLIERDLRILKQELGRSTLFNSKNMPTISKILAQLESS